MPAVFVRFEVLQPERSTEASDEHSANIDHVFTRLEGFQLERSSETSDEQL